MEVKKMRKRNILSILLFSIGTIFGLLLAAHATSNGQIPGGGLVIGGPIVLFSWFSSAYIWKD